jgi:ABC-type transporter lipoprotein component MlaA
MFQFIYDTLFENIDVKIALENTVKIVDDDEVFAYPPESYNREMYLYNVNIDSLIGSVIIDPTNNGNTFTHCGISVQYIIFIHILFNHFIFLSFL